TRIRRLRSSMCGGATPIRYSTRASTTASSALPRICWVAWRRAARTTAAGVRFCTGAVPYRRTRLLLAGPDQLLEILPTHDAAACFEVADHGDEALGQRRRHAERSRFRHRRAEQRADFGFSAAHRQVTPDSRLRLRVRAVVGRDDRHRAPSCDDVAARG